MFPKGVRAYWRNVALEHLNEDVIDVLVRRGAEQTWTGTAFDVHHMGGAFSRVGVQDSPFPSRSAQYWINIYGFWPDAEDDAARVAFVRGMADDLEPLSTGGHYVNFQGREDDGHRLRTPRQPSVPRRTPDWLPSSAAWTRRTCSTSTRTSRPDRAAGRLWVQVTRSA